jgi:uncharacterized membrane protein
VSLSSILDFVGRALLVMALVFLAIGVLRARPVSAQDSSNSGVSADEIQRLERIWRADWRSAASLLCLALLAFALTLLGNGPFFTESSGNAAGGLVLIAGILGLILAIVLVIRYIALSRALRDLDNRTRN